MNVANILESIRSKGREVTFSMPGTECGAKAAEWVIGLEGQGVLYIYDSGEMAFEIADDNVRHYNSAEDFIATL